MSAEPVQVGHSDSAAPLFESDVADVADCGPTALRIAIGGQLRKLREECGITPADAGRHIRGSHAKISRLELGRTGFKERDVADLLTLYGVRDPDQREMVLALVRKANRPGWWHPYSDLLPPWFQTYLGLEGAATLIRTFECHLVPGLLQTREYARAVVALGRRESAEARRRVELRHKRQQILDARGGPMLWAVLDEAVLRRPIGGATVMREQMEHLVRMSDRPNVTIQVIPFLAGGIAAAGTSFTLLRFAEQVLPDIVYLEQVASAMYLDRREDVDVYRELMDILALQAQTRQQSRDMLVAAAARF
ncbi:helix-turn-helix domain-containing protein [Nocardia arthritidis]|uniref:Helix-turn-helix domain-containing protein n=1 Tax=Nocardia arthritidis TaxID=228602 RepID=A0A6G9YNX1_9NOCA|nr:helix-turn-helix transcriptional regulator [Nocardia arthritidis]QIS14777.1 helix-turn-helix domain-containing protein [Nocardia arthritidis]